MPVSSIAQILLRIFALNWFLTGAIQLATMSFQNSVGSYYYLSFAPSLVFFIAGVVAWLWAPRLSRLLVRGNDCDIDLNGVTQEHLFATAVLALGLYFALDSFANVFNWIHYFVVTDPRELEQNQDRGSSYYDFTQQALTFLSGIVLVLTARLWAAKLCRNKKATSQ